MAAIPVLTGAVIYAQKGFLPGGTERNRQHVRPHTRLAPALTAVDEALLYDPQTSGGLLVIIAPESAEQTVVALQNAAIPAVRIGSVTAAKVWMLADVNLGPCGPFAGRLKS